MKETCNHLLAFPLDQAINQLSKNNIPYVINKTIPPGFNKEQGAGQLRVIKKVYKNNILYLTVAEENWQPFNARNSGSS